MDSDYIQEFLIVDRYVQGSLSDSEIAEFEERLTWDESLVDEVRLAEQLRSGLRHVAEHNPEAMSTTGIREKISGFFAVPQYAAAASFLLAVGLTSMLFFNQQFVDNGGGVPTGATNIVRLENIRSTSVAPVDVDLNGWTVLLVDAPLDARADFYEFYRATVRRDDIDGEVIWQRDALTPTYESSLAIGIDSSLLSPGRYLLRIEGQTEAGSYTLAQDLPFQANPAP